MEVILRGTGDNRPGKRVGHNDMRRALGVEGVGKGPQMATQEVRVPGAVRSIEGRGFDSSYTAPVLPDSD
eukprot:14431801-Heterocapsa_arctica.AAC.1